jgi:DNA-directed RNA polymerase subunit RPC12/RpoP
MKLKTDSKGVKMTESKEGGIGYECIKCGKRVTYGELTSMLELKCPNCGYRVLKKTRPPLVKHVKAR